MTSVLLDQRLHGPTRRPTHRRPSGRPRRHVSPATRAAIERVRHTPIDLGDHVGVGVATPPHGTRDAGDLPIVLHPVDPKRAEAADPPYGAASHPVLHQLGPAAQRYLRLARARRRRYLTRRVATAALLLGTVASCAAFASTDTRLPGAVAAAADAEQPVVDAPVPAAVGPGLGGVVPRTPAVREQLDVTANGSTASVAPTRVAPSPSATRDRFTGAYARPNGRFVAYPANRNHPFLVCTRSHESDTAGGYRAISKHGTFRGAYQFRRSTWNNVARHVRRYDLVGVDPAAASPADQDWMALYLYRWLGASHWEGRCAGL